MSVSGAHFLRDGVVWVPHGLNNIAFDSAPVNRVTVFATAYNNFNAAEVAAMKEWGNDTIRFQVAQAGLDSQDTSYDPAFLGEVVSGVTIARAAGLNVIVSVQDEPVPGEKGENTPLPNEGTSRAWQVLAPAFKGDNGILFEILNEPKLTSTPANWAAWAWAMNNVVMTIRNAGATNVLIADGLGYGGQLDGATLLADPLNQVAYASHPYFRDRYDQTAAGNGQPGSGWDARFGNVPVSYLAPVIVTEWSLETNAPQYTINYCDADSNQAGLDMLNYLQSKGIGLLAFSYDLPNLARHRNGRVTIDDQGTPSTLVNTGCSDVTFGPGTIIQNWYRTGIVPSSLE